MFSVLQTSIQRLTLRAYPLSSTLRSISTLLSQPLFRNNNNIINTSKYLTLNNTSLSIIYNNNNNTARLNNLIVVRYLNRNARRPKKVLPKV